MYTFIWLDISSPHTDALKIIKISNIACIIRVPPHKWWSSVWDLIICFALPPPSTPSYLSNMTSPLNISPYKSVAPSRRTMATASAELDSYLMAGTHGFHEQDITLSNTLYHGSYCFITERTPNAVTDHVIIITIVKLIIVISIENLLGERWLRKFMKLGRQQLGVLFADRKDYKMLLFRKNRGGGVKWGEIRFWKFFGKSVRKKTRFWQH